jgi:hypothetical protein
MRKVVNFLRKTVNLANKIYVDSFGDELEYWELIDEGKARETLYNEDLEHSFSPSVKFYGIVDYTIISPPLSKFGIDDPDEAFVYVNYEDCIKILGHPPVIGSIISEQNGDQWRIINTSLIKHKLWGKYKLQLMCERFIVSEKSGKNES